ncbi:hypothetical protein BDR04DRAFT_1037330 [Suillus decipiens]|nr:hypothetical protein BDR04DRAFT_1037330 [Suillus decipiens]
MRLCVSLHCTGASLKCVFLRQAKFIACHALFSPLIQLDPVGLSTAKCPAYPRTFNRSQGLALRCVILDLGTDAFAHGQLYS